MRHEYILRPEIEHGDPRDVVDKDDVEVYMT